LNKQLLLLRSASILIDSQWACQYMTTVVFSCIPCIIMIHGMHPTANGKQAVTAELALTTQVVTTNASCMQCIVEQAITAQLALKTQVVTSLTQQSLGNHELALSQLQSRNSYEGQYTKTPSSAH
jgi:hypothetical protein